MIKDYIIQERLGVGAFGIVYKVLKKTNNNIYVIKQVPLFGLSEKQITDVKLEAKILSSVKSIYIVRYYDSFEENNYLNIVMEYCDGGDLNQFIEKNKESNILLKEDLIWTIFLKITIGLATLHKSKILHRDLKALNIFLTKNLDIKIGDFGVAKILTQTGFAKTLIGTPYYLSPELCDEQPYNDKSDVWALGCILYELCTYNHPFNAKCQASLILKILQSNPEPINKDYSENLQKLINLILDKNHKTRPSCNEILNYSFVLEKAKNVGLYEKIKCLYPEFVLTKKIIKNNCYKSCANFSDEKLNNNHGEINDKRVLQTEEVKNFNYNKINVRKYINLDSFNKKSKDKSKSKSKKKYNIIYFENKSKDNNENNNSKIKKFKKIKERIEKIERRSRSKSYDRNKNKKSKDRLRMSNISHCKSKSINKSKSTNRKNRVNKSIEEFEKNIKKKKNYRKNALILHKSKTPLKFNNNYLSLNDDDIFNNNFNINTSSDNKKLDKNIQNSTNMTEFANYLNNYSIQHKQTEVNNNKIFNNKKSLSKEKIRIHSDYNRIKKAKPKNKNKSKSKSIEKSKERSKEKTKEKVFPSPINYSVNLKQNSNFKNLYINSNNNILKTNSYFNNANINIYNNINNIQINNINNIINLNNKKNSKEKPKINKNKYIIYNQKKYLINYNFNNKNSKTQDKSKSNEKKKENRLYINKNKIKQSYMNYDNNYLNSKFKNSNNFENIFTQMKNDKEVIKDEILKLIGEREYNYIMELYEKAFNNNEQNKIHEYFELINKFVKSKFDNEMQEKFDHYFYSLMSIDCYLNTKL